MDERQGRFANLLVLFCLRRRSKFRFLCVGLVLEPPKGDLRLALQTENEHYTSGNQAPYVKKSGSARFLVHLKAA